MMTQLLELIKNRTAPVIVDVRSQWEYESGHIPGAQHIPFYAWCCMANTARGHG